MSCCKAADMADDQSNSRQEHEKAQFKNTLNEKLQNTSMSATPLPEMLKMSMEIFHSQNFKIFKDRSGVCWSILRFILGALFGVSHIMVAIIFITFYIYALSFVIIILLGFSLEMVTVEAQTRTKEVLLSIVVFFFVFFLTINVMALLSFFWEVTKAVLFKRAVKVKLARFFLVVLVLIGATVWLLVEQKDNIPDITLKDFVMTATKLSWCFAFGICLLGTIVLRVKVFKARVEGKLAFALYLVVLCLSLLMAILGPIILVVIVNNNPPLRLIIISIVLPLVTALMTTIAYLRGKSLNGKLFTYNKGICLFFLALFFFTILSMTYLTVPGTCTGSCREKALQDLPKKPANVTTTRPALRYPICERTWTEQKINIAELAFIAGLTYHKAVECSQGIPVLTHLMHDFFHKRSLQWNVTKFTKSDRNVVHLQHNTTHIIAIKGPVTTKQFARDAKLWLELGVLKAVGSILPFIEHLPADFISHFISHAALPAKIFQGNTTSSFRELEQFIASKTINNNENDVLLVGHSMAGGLAKIIGARLQIPAVSFSSPGIANSHVKFEFSQDNALKTAVSITPEYDVFSLLDRNAGIAQRIACSAKVSGKCHFIAMTYCDLHNVCGQGAAECSSTMDI